MRGLEYVTTQPLLLRSPEPSRAVRLVRDHAPEHISQCADLKAIAPKIGSAPETLRRWMHQAEQEAGRRTIRTGVTAVCRI